MNHYDTYINEFLSRNKAVSFDKIGHLSYYGKTASADEMPVSGPLQFTFDKKAATTKELVEYIAAQTGKNKTLIESDIESYFELMRQIINIGNPHEIEGLGVFKMNKAGVIEFYIPDPTLKKDEYRTSKKQQSSLTSTSFQPGKKKSKSALMVFAGLIIVGVLAVIGWGTYKLFISNPSLFKQTDTAEQVTILPPADTTAKTTNTATVQQPVATVNPNDSAFFKFIHETTRYSIRAERRTAQLVSFGNTAAYDSLNTDSGKIYRLYLKLKILPADSTKIKDSLQKNFSRAVTIDRGN